MWGPAKQTYAHPTQPHQQMMSKHADMPTYSPVCNQRRKNTHQPRFASRRTTSSACESAHQPDPLSHCPFDVENGGVIQLSDTGQSRLQPVDGVISGHGMSSTAHARLPLRRRQSRQKRPLARPPPGQTAPCNPTEYGPESLHCILGNYPSGMTVQKGNSLSGFWRLNSIAGASVGRVARRVPHSLPAHRPGNLTSNLPSNLPW